jgi:murein DD-endopeptidase MepM/ murein hydrolase activator NlpD
MLIYVSWNAGDVVCRQDPVTHFWYKLIVALACAGATAGTAAESSSFSSVSWAPRSIRVGAPCLFKVDMPAAPSSLQGKWQGRDLVFFSVGQGHTWYGLAGVDVEAKPESYTLELDATMPDGRLLLIVREVQVQPAAYKTVRLSVSERFVQPDPEALRKIELDKELKKKAFARQTSAPEWSGSFHVPINSTVSEAFGTRRTFNGKLASIHRGVDYHAKEGTPILAANAGTVVLAQELYYEGNCVIIDHGQQFMTLYMHLSHIDVTGGEKVAEGQRIGLSGATGRATGPHLHVAVRWQGAYLDPTVLWNLPLPALPPQAGQD